MEGLTMILKISLPGKSAARTAIGAEAGANVGEASRLARCFKRCRCYRLRLDCPDHDRFPCFACCCRNALHPAAFSRMSEPLPILIQSSLQIAFDFLQRSGEITDAVEAGTFLLGTINHLLMKGERRNLVLSNKAITEYKKFKAERNPDAASG